MFMKTKFFAFLAIPLVISQSHAQITLGSLITELKESKMCFNDFGAWTQYKEDSLLVYDFTTKRFFYGSNTNFKRLKNLNDFKLGHHQSFRVIVMNVNRYLYEVKVATDDVELTSRDTLDLFKGLGLGDASKLLDYLTKLSKGGDGFALMEEKEELFINKTRSFTKKLFEIEKTRIGLYNYGACNEIKCYTCDNAVDKHPIDEMLADLRDIKIEYLKISSSLNTKIVELTEFKNCPNDVDRFTDSLKKPNLDLKKKKRFEERIKECNGINYNDEMAKLDTYKTRKAAIDSLMTMIYKIKTEELISSIMTVNNAYKDHYYFVSPPIYPGGHRLNLSLNIRPITNPKTSYMPMYADSISIEAFVKGKWAITFSSGPFFNNFNSEYSEYGWKPIIEDDSTRYKLDVIGKSKTSYGLATFANFGLPLNRSLALGISSGVGLTISSEPKPAFFLGGHLAIGDKSQFVVSGGISVSIAKSLNTDFYNLQQSYPNDKTELHYSTTPATGCYISLSYAFLTPSYTKKGTSKSKKS